MAARKRCRRGWSACQGRSRAARRPAQADRLRHQLRDFSPAALEAYGDLGLDSADVLELLAKAPGPASAARLTTAQISAPLKHADRQPELGPILGARACYDQLRAQNQPRRRAPATG